MVAVCISVWIHRQEWGRQAPGWLPSGDNHGRKNWSRLESLSWEGHRGSQSVPFRRGWQSPGCAGSCHTKCLEGQLLEMRSQGPWALSLLPSTSSGDLGSRSEEARRLKNEGLRAGRIWQERQQKAVSREEKQPSFGQVNCKVHVSTQEKSPLPPLSPSPASQLSAQQQQMSLKVRSSRKSRTPEKGSTGSSHTQFLSEGSTEALWVPSSHFVTTWWLEGFLKWTAVLEVRCEQQLRLATLRSPHEALTHAKTMAALHG